MAHVALNILWLVFLFQAPILFYLKHRFKWQINHALLALFSFILGWFSFSCLLFTGNSRLPGQGYPVQVILIIALFGGWQISAGLLLLWSPVIIILSVKNKKIKLAMGLIVVGLVSFAAILYFSSQFERSVQGNRLVHEGSHRSGFFDGSHIWVFEAENDLLKQKMIRKWKLKPMSAYWGRSHPISFAATGRDKPDWWPSENVLDSLEGYSFIHDSDELYRSLWYDPDNQRLYLERGNW